MLDTVNFWLATGFGLGLAPMAPGTFGSLLGIPLAWWLLSRPLGQQGAIMQRCCYLRYRFATSLPGTTPGWIMAVSLPMNMWRFRWR